MADSSPSVLLIRLDAIGDALALTPLLAALRQNAIPVDLVLGSVNATVFSSAARRRVDVAPFALRAGDRNNRRAIARFGASLAPRGYSHVLVATEDPGGLRLAAAVGAPHRVGFVNGWGKPLKTLWAAGRLTRRVVRTAGLDPRAPHECEVLFQLGSGLIAEREPTRDLARLRPLLLDLEPPRDARVVVQVTDKWARLGIDDGDVVALLQRVQAFGMRPIAAASERAYADRIAHRAALPIERFERLAEWKAAIAGAAALVAPDSGAVHVAGMVGTPTVAIFPPARNAALQRARWAPWAAPSRVLEARAGWPHAAAAALAQLLA